MEADLKQAERRTDGHDEASRSLSRLSEIEYEMCTLSSLFRQDSANAIDDLIKYGSH
jgi:hypothetical protein